MSSEKMLPGRMRQAAEASGREPMHLPKTAVPTAAAVKRSRFSVRQKNASITMPANARLLPLTYPAVMHVTAARQNVIPSAAVNPGKGTG